jgi:hypothetical protein
MFIGELRIGKHQIRSRILGHLIVDRVSRNLRKAGRKGPLEGSRFTACFNQQHTFRFTTECRWKIGERAAPANYPARCFHPASRSIRPKERIIRWVIRGSRLFLPISANTKRQDE